MSYKKYFDDVPEVSPPPQVFITFVKVFATYVIEHFLRDLDPTVSGGSRWITIGNCYMKMAARALEKNGCVDNDKKWVRVVNHVQRYEEGTDSRQAPKSA